MKIDFTPEDWQLISLAIRNSSVVDAQEYASVIDDALLSVEDGPEVEILRRKENV